MFLFFSASYLSSKKAKYLPRYNKKDETISTNSPSSFETIATKSQNKET